MAYCKENDLLLQGNTGAIQGEKARFINAAADEMDSRLGYTYQVPINIAQTGDPGAPVKPLPRHQVMILKDINAKLASGRYLMAQANPTDAIAQYALYLVKDAETMLLSLANGQIDLLAPKVDPSGDPIGTPEQPEVSDTYARIPTGWNPDQTSMVTLFEKNYMDPRRLGYPATPWVPGENIDNDGRVEKLI